MQTEQDAAVTPSEPRWRPLPAVERRVVGVLAEKAKTTPNAYPLTLNALVAGCNQKSNRDPQLNLTADDVEQALDALKQMGAVREVIDSGRVSKYRHLLYEWLGVDKAELSLMTELLLRGAQTVGELRQRVHGRMETIPDQATLRPLLDALVQKRLVTALTPPGRGQIVTHMLYLPAEWDSVRRACGSPASASSSEMHAAPDAGPQVSASASPPAASVARAGPTHGGPLAAAGSTAAAPPLPSAAAADLATQLRREIAELRAEVDRLRQDVQDLWSNLR